VLRHQVGLGGRMTRAALTERVDATRGPGPEVRPVTPVQYAGFSMKSVGSLHRNPTVDVPPPVARCHQRSIKEESK
jgi:hypothetical protein